MCWVVFKFGSHWYVVAKRFNIKGPTSQYMIFKFIEHLSDAAFGLLVKENEMNFKFRELIEDGMRFRNYHFVRNALMRLSSSVIGQLFIRKRGSRTTLGNTSYIDTK